MFIRIKNAARAGHESVRIPYSKFKHEIIKTLERAGLVGKPEKKGKRIKKFLEIPLLFKEKNEPMVQEVHLISKPSRRYYCAHKALRTARHGGVVVISTPKGILTEKEARAQKIGGELIAEIW